MSFVKAISMFAPGGLFRGRGNGKGQSRLSRRPKVRFPDDEGAHSTSLIEWWYANFNLEDSVERKYGAMAAYFNMGLKIISVSDLETDYFHHEVYGSAPHFSEGALNLRWGGRDHWFRTDANSFSYQLEARGTEIDLNLNMVSQKPPLLAGGDGLIEWSGGLSYYYSLTHLKVEGQIRLRGKTVDVRGIGWMDHQWMESLGERGWDWFSVQLDNQTEINCWQIVNPDESIESRALMIMFPDCSVYHTRNLSLERMDSWISPESGKKYAVRWRIQEETRGLDLEIRACQAKQEIRMFEDLPSNTFDFWEGSMVVSGHLGGKAVSGVGHAEFVRLPKDSG